MDFKEWEKKVESYHNVSHENLCAMICKDVEKLTDQNSSPKAIEYFANGLSVRLGAIMRFHQGQLEVDNDETAEFLRSFINESIKGAREDSKVVSIWEDI